ncbi:MAG: dihydroneopterin aldolase [Alphaproteobacteria bacterium]|nr:dihydroneopterin aldolase [Alphaproteobacteria bacterium]
MSTARTQVIEPLRIADARHGIRHVFVRDLDMTCVIGVHAHEKRGPQRVRINVDLGVVEGHPRHDDRLENVVCYEDIVTRIRAIVADGHINLVETLAERIADICLQHPLAFSARIRVEKLDVFADAAGAGVEIERLAPPRGAPRG